MKFEPNSEEVVIREIDRLQHLIEGDTATTDEVRIALLERLAVERSSFEAWLTRYASYFREPRTWSLDLAPVPSALTQREAQVRPPVSGESPRVIVFADFGGFSHRISYPDADHDATARSDIRSMISAELYEFMEQWASEFHRHAWDDAMRGKHGTMQWVPFDIQGMSIARAIKLSVGHAARVFYLKPSEDPFVRYDYAREVLADGEVLSDEYGV